VVLCFRLECTPAFVREAPLLRAVILILLMGVIVSLFSGLTFLFKDTHVDESRRTLYALGIRVALAAALLIAVFYGLYTGELGLDAPWHRN
jgi:hypothetical protein